MRGAFLRNFILLIISFLGLSAHAEVSKIKYTDVQIHTDNVSSFNSKLALIDKAQKNIDICYFIIDSDYTTSLLIEKLLAKTNAARAANQPLQVRILVDYFMSEKQLPLLRLLDAHEDITILRYGAPSESWKKALKELNIDGPLFVSSLMSQNLDGLKESVKNAKLKIDLASLAELAAKKATNPLEWAARVAARVNEGRGTQLNELEKNQVASFYEGLIEFLHRTHHKLLLVDGQHYQMGGRNLSDEYHAELTDVLIQGNNVIPKRTYAFNDLDVVSSLVSIPSYEESPLTKSFESLWSANRNISLQDTEKDYTAAELDKKTNLIEEVSVKAKEAQHLLNAPKNFLEISTLSPSEALYIENKEITEFYIRALDSLENNDEAVFVNAYFFLDNLWITKEGEALNRLYRSFLSAAKRGAKVRVFTNSIKTTDLNVVNAFAYPEYRKLVEAGIQLYELSDKQGPQQLRSSLHMKGGYYLNKSGLKVIVGSYNLDPRSHARDTNNALVLSIPEDQTSAVKEKLDVLFNTKVLNDPKNLNWIPITVEGDSEATENNLLELEKIANEEAHQKTRRILFPFKIEI